MKQICAPIISNDELIPGIFLMTMEAPDIVRIARPGQFVMVDCGDDFLINRPLSIHRMEKPSKMSILYALAGEGTRNLSMQKTGDTVRLIGPLGNGFSIDTNSKKLLLVAGGIGIAPMVFLAENAIAKGKSVNLIIGASTSSLLYPLKLLPPVDNIAVTTEDGTAGTNGLVTDMLLDFIDDADRIFACGPISMYKTIYESAKLEGQKRHIEISMEVRMGCGMGMCYGCSIKTVNGMRLVCHDGPVFNMEEIFWEELT